MNLDPQKILSHPGSFKSCRVGFGVLLLCCILLIAVGAGAAESRVSLPKSVGAMRSKIAVTKRSLDAADLTASLNFSIALQMRDFADLQARVSRGETISRKELEERYLPLQSDYEAVKTWAKSQGLTLTQEDDSRMSVFVRGSVSQVRSSLQVSMVKVTADGKDYAAADSQPSLPASIASAVIGVNGLHPYRHLHKHSIMRPQATGGIAPFYINDILTAYDAQNLSVTSGSTTTTITGAGQTIAILIDATPKTTDLTTFYANASNKPKNGTAQTTSNVTTVNVTGTTAAIEGEETLDAEWAGGIASGAKLRVYAVGSLDDASLDAGFARIISDLKTDSTIHQLSISLGLGELYEDPAQFTTDAQYLATLASQGVSTFVSSGDGGSTPDDGTVSDTDEDAGPLQVEYYASDPSVTAVGGTSITLTTAYAYSSEKAWSGSGGGVSVEFNRPSWQSGTGVPPGTKRCVPDVCMPADPDTGAYVYYNGGATQYGGTSWSAPTWAGFCALINQARAATGKTGGMGLLNPSLYPLIGTGNFHDVTTGSNAEGGRASGNYSATTGYDTVTGVGSPDVKVLMNTLITGTSTVAAPTITSFTPTSGAANTIVSITGTGLANTERVVFNTSEAAFAIISGTQILATVPSNATTGVITVTKPGGIVTSTGSFTFTATSAVPTISDYEPGDPAKTGTTAGTVTSLTLDGTNMSATTAVTFGGVAAPLGTKTATSVIVTIPSGAKTGAISVTNASGTAVSAATFTGAASIPTITNFTPTSGTAGSTSVTITGTNLLGETAVLFNGIPATTFTVTSPTSITVPVPTGATTGAITVVGRGGTGASTTNFMVGGTTVSAPTITGFTPTSGPVGTSVTITGTAFTGATAVSFNGTSAGTFTVSSDTQIVVTVPGGATTGTISVTTPGGTATSTGSFTVTTTGTSAPTITGFTPTSGPVGTSVTITGTNLTGVTAVLFNGTAASITNDTATQIVVTVPTGATTGTISVTTAGGTVTSAGMFTVTTSGGTTSSTVVISQVYGGGGSGSATYLNDYVELFNPSTTAVDLSAYSIQYASATGASYSGKTPLTGSILPQHYYLVQEAAGTTGTGLPPADASGSISMAAAAGRVALVSNQTTITSKTSTGVVDFVGYGTTAIEYEGAGRAPAPSATAADFRANGGYTDTNNNSSDFATAAPNPRNSSTSNISSGVPDLTVTLTHASSFTQADTGDTYTITVSNGGTAATSGTVSVSDTLPTGITATALSGTGWTIAANNLSATRTDALAPGGSYPALTLTVNVSSTAASSVTNTASVSGGGETNTSNDTASDPTAITALTPSQSWRYQYFGTTANTGNAADTANPSGDGLPNLIKYATGLNPLVPTMGPVTVDVSTGYLRLSTPKNPNATDVTLAVQVSGDLTNPSSWTTTGTTVDQNTTTLLQVQDATAVSGAAERFLRLTVTRP